MKKDETDVETAFFDLVCETVLIGSFESRHPLGEVPVLELDQRGPKGGGPDGKGVTDRRYGVRVQGPNKVKLG